MKGKNGQPRIFYPARLSFRFDREIKSFIDEQKLRKFSTIRPTLQWMLKELLQEAGRKRSQNQKQEITNGKAHWQRQTYNKSRKSPVHKYDIRTSNHEKTLQMQRMELKLRHQ